jgi:hypothetical protein
METIICAMVTLKHKYMTKVNFVIAALSGVENAKVV